MYGATEAAVRIAYVPPDDFERKIASIGRSVRGVQLRVLDPQGPKTAAGEHGELVASGPNIMQGYWKDPEATALVLDADGYRTGGHRLPRCGGVFLRRGPQRWPAEGRRAPHQPGRFSKRLHRPYRPAMHETMPLGGRW